MTWTYTDEYYKNYTRDTWNDSAEGYGHFLRNLNLYNMDLLRHARPQAGERVLDVATGPGEPALTIGPMVAPGGSVLGIDLAERMVELARRTAKGLGRENVDFKVMDAEKLELPDASFDLVVCRFGLMIVTDPDQVVREVLRVLKPGGRFVATVWGPGERVPAIHAIIAPMLEHAEPDENGYLPTPYEMGGEGELAAILREAGFREASEERVTHDFHVRDEEEYLDMALKGSPIGHSLEEEDPEVQEHVIRKTRENLQAWKTPKGLVMPSEAVVVKGTK